MKFRIIYPFIVFISSCISPYSFNKQIDTNYGQKPPGLTPQVFAPGIISTRFHEHSAPAFSKDGKEMLFTLSCEHGHTIMYTKLIKNKWIEPIPAPFSGKHSDDVPVWSATYDTLYFISKRPVFQDDSGGFYNNWYVCKQNGKWTKASPNNFSVNSLSANGNIYFHHTKGNGDIDIFMSDKKDNYRMKHSLPSNINSPGIDGTPFIASDESFLIFTSQGREENIGIMDLYISYKTPDGNWSESINMGEEINYPGSITRFPGMSPDGKFLFFCSNKSEDKEGSCAMTKYEKALLKYHPMNTKKDNNIYWIDARIIEELKPNYIK
jgi:Tol biopolymer transport system component